MPTATYAPPGSTSSAEFLVVDPQRGVDIQRKHQLVIEFLETHRFDALLLERASNFAWFTCGGDCTRGCSSDTTAALFITPQAHVVITRNVDSQLLFDRQVQGMGFQLKERPWYESRHVLTGDICRGRTVASDTASGETHDVSPHLLGMRIPLSPLECEKLRDLGPIVAHAVEATARNFERGQTEAEIAGQLAHRLMKRQVHPERIQVCADGQNWRYRHWTYGGDPVDQYCVISAVGRRDGLYVAATRTVCFGQPPQELRAPYHRALLMLATGMYFSQADWELFETWNRVQRIYEKFDCPEEWQFADQAEIIGYELCEIPVVPKSEFRFGAGMAVFWHPSIGPALVGDTILVGERDRGPTGFELLTPVDRWPKAKVEVRGAPVFCPDILRRDASVRRTT